jgi:hypothetical protein
LPAASMKPRKWGLENISISKFMATPTEWGATKHVAGQRGVWACFCFGAMRSGDSRARVPEAIPGAQQFSPVMPTSSRGCITATAATAATATAIATAARKRKRKSWERYPQKFNRSTSQATGKSINQLIDLAIDFSYRYSR